MSIPYVIETHELSKTGENAHTLLPGLVSPTAGNATLFGMKLLYPGSVSDLVFLLTALAFNLLLAAFFVAQGSRWEKTARIIGIVWLLLAIPLTFVFALYLAEGRGPAFLVPLALVLLYMLVEFLLDFVFKVDFRRSWKTHVPYIVLEYIALFSLIGIAFSIHRSWGYLVSVTFWILLACLIYYLLAGRIRIRKRQASKG